MSGWRVGVMGAGMMAQGFDKPGDNQVLSMAHAFTRAPQFILGGFYDQDLHRAEEAEQKWGCPITPRSRDKWLNSGWDVIYIATPDECHADDFHHALAHRPQAILIEKPLTTDGAEALNLLQRAMQLGVLVMVDYPRRWHSVTSKVKEFIRKGKLGIPVSAVFTVSGGVMHNLPHLLDLFLTWWGGGWQVSFNNRQDDMTCLTFLRDNFSLSATIINRPSQPYYVFEMYIYCSDSKVELSQSPEVVKLFEPKPHPSYPTYRVLTPFFRAEMEEEPLLCHTLEALATAMANPVQAEEAYRREIESQMFMAEVFRHF